MDLLKQQNESNKQFFPKVINGKQQIVREERERYREFFSKLGKAMFSNNTRN